MPTEKNLSNLIINKVESKAVYDYMTANNLVNEDELYLVSGDDEIKIDVDAELSSTSENPVQNKVVTEAISDLQSLVGNTSVASQIATATANKVDKVDGKDLSANDYTDEDKSKLDGIEAGANKTIIDSKLSSTSTNPVQNKVVNTSITTFNDVVGDTAYGNLLIDGTIVANHYNTVDITPPTSRKASAFRFDVIFPQLNDSNKDMIKTITVYYQGTRIYTIAMKTFTRSHDNTSYATSTCSCNAASTALTNISTYGFKVIYLDSSGSEVAITDIAFPIYIRFCSMATPSLVTPGWWELPKPSNVDATLTVEGDAADAKATGDAIANKVDKVDGKGLSTNDYTTGEKNKLSGIATGAEVNQNAFSNVVVGSTTIAADSKTDSLTIVAGNNITITPDVANDKLTITAKDTTYNEATTSAAGLMSASDKTKLNGIADGANKTIIDSALSSTSTNPVQNKVVNTAISNLSQLVDNKVGTNELNTAVENALTEAKNSGEFNGPQGPKGEPGASGVYVGADAPIDPDVNVWIDPDGETSFKAIMPVVKTDEMTQAVGMDEAGRLWALPGGGNDTAELLAEVTLEEEVNHVVLNLPGECYKRLYILAATKATANSGTDNAATRISINEQNSYGMNAFSAFGLANSNTEYGGIFRGVVLLEDSFCMGFAYHNRKKWGSSTGYTQDNGNIDNFYNPNISRNTPINFISMMVVNNGTGLFGIGSELKVWGVKA